MNDELVDLLFDFRACRTTEQAVTRAFARAYGRRAADLERALRKLVDEAERAVLAALDDGGTLTPLGAAVDAARAELEAA